ncbi:MAG: ATP-binding protein, partial [Myxococcales bacterium]|nr:ATP-binding protein [Myxococcales bacterium]
MPEALALRSPSRRARSGGHGSSCDLLIELATHEAVASVLAEVGVDTKVLPKLRDRIQEEIEAEPADWHLRLQQRGGRPGPEGDLGQLLAIVRSADCHAYRALQLAGADSGQLRKLLIERVRERGHLRANRRSEPAVHGKASGGTVGPLRMSASRSGAEPTSRRNEEVPRAAGTSRPAPPSPRRSVAEGRSPAESRPLRVPATPAASVAVRPSTPKADPRSGIKQDLRSDAELQAKRETTGKSKQEAELRSLHPAELPPMAGRERELAMLADALLRRTPRPPILVGEHGSGRSLLAMHLARVLSRPVFRLEAPTYDDDEGLLGDDLELIAEAGGVVVFDDLDRVASDGAPPFLPALARAWATGEPRILTVLSHETRARLEVWMPGILDTLDLLLLPPLESGEIHRAVKLASPAILEQHGL